MTGPGKFNGPDLSKEFHAYKLEWTENFIKTYIDNKLVLNFQHDKNMWEKGGYEGPNSWAG